MKERLLVYFILLPIILLVAFTNIVDYLKYLAFASIPLSIGLIVYAYIKTRAFYKTKKVLAFIIFAFALSMPLIANAQTSMASIQLRAQEQQQYKRTTAQNNESLYDEYLKVKQELRELSKIPESSRTREEQKAYEEKKQKLTEISRKLNNETCLSVKQLRKELASSCWACDIANLFIESADRVVSSFYKMDKQYGFSKSLLVIGFIFWLFVHVIKLLMSFGQGDIGAFFTDLFVKLLLVGGIFILLTLPMKNIVNITISPFFLLSSTVSQYIGRTAVPEGSVNTAYQADENMCTYCADLASGENSQVDESISGVIGYHPSKEDRVVSQTMRNSLLCTVCSIYNVTVKPTATGQFLLCNAKKKKEKQNFGDGVVKKTYTDWDPLFTSLILIFTFFAVSAIFSFYLIDTFFRIAFVLVLLPFLVVAAAFKSTLFYTKKGFEVIIHSMFTYIIVALFMAISIQLFYYMFGQANEFFNATDYAQLKEIVDFGGKDNHIFLSCLGLTAIVFFMMGKLDTYISSLSGVKLGNENGFQSAQQMLSAAMVAPQTVSQIYSASKKDSVGSKDSKPSAGANPFTESNAEAVEKGGEATANGIEQGGEAAASGVESGGEGAAAGLDGIAAGLDSTVVGAVVGVVLHAVAAVTRVVTKAAAVAIRVATKVVAKVIKVATKIAAKVMKAIAKIRKFIQKVTAPIRKVSKFIGRGLNGAKRVVNAIMPKNLIRKAVHKTKEVAKKKYREIKRKRKEELERQNRYRNTD